MKMQAPLPDCLLCPRLQAFRDQNKTQFPDKGNASVPSFGSLLAQILIVGLAPGLRGANFTGRPFTGDYAGELLYETLIKYGLAQGVYKAHEDDGLTLINCRVTNAVRCVPPQNKPTPLEIQTCRAFLVSEISAMKNLRCIVALGHVAQKTVVYALGYKPSAYPFTHGAEYILDDQITLISSYHCSRYNTQTRRLTPPMFEAIFARVVQKSLS